MRKAVFSGFLKTVIFALVVCSIMFSYLIGRYMEKRTESDMMYSVRLIDYNLDYNKNLQEQIDKLNSLVYDVTSRISIIDKDGEVLADTSSLIDYEDNHSNRAEVIEAIKNGEGENKRFSSTLHKDLIYVAKYSKKGNCVVRLAIPFNGHMAFTAAIIPSVIISILIAFLASLFISKRLSKTITEPLNEISNELLKIQNNGQLISFKRYKYDEINNIVKSTEILSERIETQMDLVKEEKNKLDNILQNMSEGLVLIDNDKQVQIINKVASEIMGCSLQTGKNIICYTQNLKINNGVDNVIKNNNECYFDLQAEGKVYVVHISKITIGILMLFMDVTYERESQNIRQNFFSDASHELKTPITSINGYAELLTSGIEYSESQKAEFLKRIRNEAENMTGLINDILMISRLEAGSEKAVLNSKNTGQVNMNYIIDDILSAVEPMAMENEIEITADIKPAVINADYNYMYQMANNVIVNGIKYNKKKGKLFILSEIENDNYVLKVRDTGIGIPMEYQKRVFERFFRVDKGRSKKMGGTGLGLAIVKHIVGFYNGSVNIYSKVDKGTEIVIKIPLNKG